MTDAERDLLLYVATKLAIHATPSGETASEMNRLVGRVLTERAASEPEKKPQ